MAISAFAIVISVIALMLTLGSDGSGHNVISSAGPLTDGHANFTSSSGCVACHEPHAKDAGEWFLAAFEENNISKNCLNFVNTRVDLDLASFKDDIWAH